MADSLPQEVSQEEEELQQIWDKIHRYPKLNMWATLFLDSTKKETFGNRTACALVAYNLDRNDPTGYRSAISIGYQNYRKLHNLAAEFVEQSGMTAGKQIELLTAKAVNSNNARYMQMLLEITGVYTPKATVAIQNNVNNNIVQVTAEEENRLDKEFAAFMTQKAKDAIITSFTSQPAGSQPETGQ